MTTARRRTETDKTKVQKIAVKGKVKKRKHFYKQKFDDFIGDTVLITGREEKYSNNTKNKNRYNSESNKYLKDEFKHANFVDVTHKKKRDTRPESVILITEVKTSNELDINLSMKNQQTRKSYLFLLPFY
jgi:hypothetical protein